MLITFSKFQSVEGVLLPPLSVVSAHSSSACCLLVACADWNHLGTMPVKATIGMNRMVAPKFLIVRISCPADA